MERFSFASEVAFVPGGDLLDRVTVAPLTPSILEGSLVQAAIFRVEAGGRIRRHPASFPQILAVLDGSGEVSGADGVDEQIEAGEAVFWHEGEEHETRSAAGLTALIVEGAELDRFRARPRAIPDPPGRPGRQLVSQRATARGHTLAGVEEAHEHGAHRTACLDDTGAGPSARRGVGCYPRRRRRRPSAAASRAELEGLVRRGSGRSPSRAAPAPGSPPTARSLGGGVRRLGLPRRQDSRSTRC